MEVFGLFRKWKRLHLDFPSSASTHPSNYRPIAGFYFLATSKIPFFLSVPLSAASSKPFPSFPIEDYFDVASVTLHLEGGEVVTVYDEESLKAAGIAPEVKNPLGGILGLAQLARRKVEPQTLLHRNLTLIEKEARRCKEIVDNLMKFARQEKGEFSLPDLNAVVEETLVLLEHQVGIQGIRLENRFDGSLPPMVGNANQLKQVFMDLVINAQQAMAGERVKSPSS